MIADALDIEEQTVAPKEPSPPRENWNLEVLHLYGQAFWHDGAYVVGTTRDLLALRDAIDKALVESHATIESFTADGEGYEITVLAVDDDTAKRLATPYTDQIAKDARTTAIQPYQLHRSLLQDVDGHDQEEQQEAIELVSTDEPPPREEETPGSASERLQAERQLASEQEGAVERQREFNAAWLRRWPDHCMHCGGWGRQAVALQAPYRDTKAGEPSSEPCTAIASAATCHRCAAPGLGENGEGPCENCGWDYDDGLPGRDP